MPTKWTNRKKLLLINLIILFYKTFVSIYVTNYSRPNSWTEWAKNFCGHSWVPGGCFRLKKSFFFGFQNFFVFKFFVFNIFFSSHGQRRALQLVVYKRWLLCKNFKIKKTFFLYNLYYSNKFEKLDFLLNLNDNFLSSYKITNFLKELSLCHKYWFSYPYIFANKCCRP